MTKPPRRHVPPSLCRSVALVACAAVLSACGGGDVRPSPAPSPAESACRAGVAAATGSGSVRIQRSRAVAGGTEVTVRAPGGDWTCRATAGGEILGLSRG